MSLASLGYRRIYCTQITNKTNKLSHLSSKSDTGVLVHWQGVLLARDTGNSGLDAAKGSAPHTTATPCHPSMEASLPKAATLHSKARPEAQTLD